MRPLRGVTSSLFCIIPLILYYIRVLSWTHVYSTGGPHVYSTVIQIFFFIHVFP